MKELHVNNLINLINLPACFEIKGNAKLDRLFSTE